jgi:two-component system phosphate regulon sensor histidine kinase PhoR
LLIPAMLAAAMSLSYYVYSYSQQLAQRERMATLGTMAELAKEKLIGIQTAIAEADRGVYEAVDFGDLAQLGQVIASTPHRSATVLGLDYEIVSGGTFRKAKERDDEAFTELLTGVVVPQLDLDTIHLKQPRYLHGEFDGRQYLFSATRLFSQGRMYFLVLEWDIAYLLAEVVPAILDQRSSNLYQVLNSQGNLVYGYPFRGIAAADIVEIGFPDTLTQWRLRVAQREARNLASGETREKRLDFVLIGVAMAVIAAGLIIMLVAVRRERRLSQLKSDFISNVSHELKTPLSIISMFGELLAMGRAKSDEQASEYAEIIQRESLRLSALIENVLDFAKIERGVAPYTFVDDQDLGEVVARAVEICRTRLEQADMTLDLDMEEPLPSTRIDVNAMVLAVQNLIDNAIKYASGGERIEVSVKKKDQRLELVVRDFGPGVPDDERKSVFDRFYRAKDVRLKPVRGSGIGLSLVKNIAEAHRGGVEIDSGDDSGCAFRIWIPITGSIREET